MSKKKYYWAEKEEEAIRFYLKTSDIEKKHQVYVETIEPAFKQLIQNIFFTYNFNKTIRDFDTVKNDLLAFLYEKIEKFNPDTGFKAFSYFGMVVKNWCIQKSMKNKKNIFIDEENKELAIYDVSIERDDIKQANNEDKELITVMENNLNESVETNDDDYDEEDLQVVEIIGQLLKEYKNIDITNKKELYIYVREATDLPTRKITKALKKIQKRYAEVKNQYINSTI